MKTLAEKLRDVNRRIAANDGDLAKEFDALKAPDGMEVHNDLLMAMEGMMPEMPAHGLEDLQLESIILRTGRPVLRIFNNQGVLEFIDERESKTWKERLNSVKAKLDISIPSVGRIELANDARYDWIGTGWLVDDKIVVTNRHVASVFATKQGNKYVFRQNPVGKRIVSSIDFLEEIDNADEFVFSVIEVLHIEDEPGPDIALLRIEPLSGKKLPTPVALFDGAVINQQYVATIGYPAWDSRLPERQLMETIFGNVYDKKRLAPGQVTGFANGSVLHDCTTLGGNSGSVVLDLESGKAIGLHFAGRFLENNFAVPAQIIRSRIEAAKKSLTTQHLNPDANGNNNGIPQEQTVMNPPEGQLLNFTIPLNVSISIGAIQGLGLTQALQADQNPSDHDEFLVEAAPEDYADRDGYLESFLGDDKIVPLPEIVDENLWNDILRFKEKGQETQVLKYRHFSVVMRKSRRLCFFSAVNIDGATSRGMNRTGWRTDPRIPKTAQILNECYGKSPKFSRGHMTRREDPIWGTEAEALQGNNDSMHVTNVVPQMQSNNAGIWLKLENYALAHSRKDKMRISVMTGPYLDDQYDQIREGVKIPTAFWKVIAFIHDDTGELCATGYKISQAVDIELVFGPHATDQVRISEIEKATGLSFGPLAALDPMAGDEEAADATGFRSLNNLSDIRFVTPR